MDERKCPICKSTKLDRMSEKFREKGCCDDCFGTSRAIEKMVNIKNRTQEQDRQLFHNTEERKRRQAEEEAKEYEGVTEWECNGCCDPGTRFYPEPCFIRVPQALAGEKPKTCFLDGKTDVRMWVTPHRGEK